jgi:hypothetical protein
MFHIELRQFPHNFCRFNLSERELRAIVLDAWAKGERVELGERGWDPAQASLTVLAGPRLQTQDLSMGRGWSNAQRQGSDVTERMLKTVREEQARGPRAGEDAVSHGSGFAAGADAARVGGASLPGGAVAAGADAARAGAASSPGGAVAAGVGAARAGAASSPGGAVTAGAGAAGVAAAAGLDAIAAQLSERLGEQPLALMRAWQLALERHPDRTPSECLALAEELVRR